MKNLIVLASMLFLLLLASCSKDEIQDSNKLDTNTSEELQYFSVQDISTIKAFVLNPENYRENVLIEDNFPSLEYQTVTSNTDSDILDQYSIRIMYESEGNILGESSNYNSIINSIMNNESIDGEGKNQLLSKIQLFQEVFNAPEVIKHFNERSENNVNSRAACDCDPINEIYVNYWTQCQIYGGGYCDLASFYRQQYLDCLAMETTCPPGFTFDGANCYSAIHIPSGYNGFIWGHGFYVQRNCDRSTANDCCPPGYGFDGANCLWLGTYIPSGYEPFIWNNTFYVVPNCI